MKLQLSINNNVKVLTFDKILIINSNLHNQIEFSDAFKEGIKKQNQTVLINGHTDFSNYHIIDYNGETFLEDLKFKKNSYSLNRIGELTRDLDIDILNNINTKLQLVNNELNTKFTFLQEHYDVGLSLQVSISSLNELIKKHISFISDDLTIPINHQREMYIINMIDSIKDDIDTDYIVLLNNLNNYLDISQIYYIIDQVYKYEHIHLIILQNDFEICDTTQCIATNYILNEKVFVSYATLQTLNKEREIHNSLLTSKERNELASMLCKEKNKKYYYKLISERQNMIF